MAAEERSSTEDLVAEKDEHVDEQPSIPEQSQPERRPALKSTVDQPVELFSRTEIDEFRDRWQTLQTAFVDDPRETVHAADELVAEVMQALATTFANHKRELEAQWRQGEDVATEELRLALQRYRTFFNELLRD